MDDTYRLEEELPSRVMGGAYVACHVRLGRRVVVRFSDGMSPEEFEEEMILRGRVQHPNIVQLLDYQAESAWGPYQVLEHIEGKTLDAELKDNDFFSVEESLHLCVQMASALEAMHQEGIIHGGLKPSRVLLCRHGASVSAKLLDLGEQQLQGQPYPVSGEIDLMSTLLYTAPERAAGPEAPALAAGDQYSLAAIVFELLSGDVPFMAHCPSSYLSVIRNQWEALACSGLDPDANAILRRALNPHAEQRHHSVMSFALRFGSAARLGSGGRSGSRELHPSGPVSMGGPTSLSGPQTIRATSLLELMLSAPTEFRELAVGCTLQLASGHSAASASSPDEAFLLSRLEYTAPLSVVLELSSMPRERALELLAGLVNRGILELSA